LNDGQEQAHVSSALVDQQLKPVNINHQVSGRYQLLDSQNNREANSFLDAINKHGKEMGTVDWRHWFSG